MQGCDKSTQMARAGHDAASKGACNRGLAAFAGQDQGREWMPNQCHEVVSVECVQLRSSQVTRCLILLLATPVESHSIAEMMSGQRSRPMT